MTLFLFAKYVHIATVALSVSLFVLRYGWLCVISPHRHQRWVRILPHLNDTLLLLSGVLLMIWTRDYPFTLRGAWLTEKLLGVTIYIILGFLALVRGSRIHQMCWFAFLLVLLAIYIITKLATT